jgi:hypothetical protein
MKAKKIRLTIQFDISDFEPADRSVGIMQGVFFCQQAGEKKAEVTIGENGCLYATGADGEEVYLGDGSITLLDEKGNPLPPEGQV